jgi:Zn-dependent protease with chaperone function
MALLLGLGLLGSWLAGRVLSSVRLGQLQAGRGAEQTASERAVDRLYGAVLWFAALLFHVAVPLLLALTLAMTGGLLLAVLRLPRFAPHLVLFVVLLGGGGLVALLRGLLTDVSEPEDGRVLTRDEAPRLFQALEEVAEVAQSRTVDRVLLFAGTFIGVREAGHPLQVLLGRGERILHLGLGALRGLTVSELKSILAHEYGHFSHGETRLTPTLSVIQARGLRMLHGLRRRGGAVFNPVFWFLRAYLVVFRHITAGHGRRRELLADRVSARAYGGDTFARALTKAVENGDTFRRGLEVAAGLREAGRPTKDLYRTLEAAARGMPPALLELTRQELLARPMDADDSHPPLSERVERIRGLPGHRPVQDEAALTLFAAPETLLGELGARMLSTLDSALEGQGLPATEPVAATDAEQERLAEAIALYQGALALRARNHPEAHGLLPRSVTRLEHAVGQEDPFLVPALTELARMYLQHQDPDAARAVLQRALGIAQARPGRERQVDALSHLLQQLPARQAA